MYASTVSSVQLNVPLDDTIHRRAKAAAAISGRSLKEFVADALVREAEAVERGQGKSNGKSRKR